VPERLGRFKVVRLLAAGGMGEVYLGEHEELGSRVALKLLPTPPGADAAAIRARFRREAVLTAAVLHPGVVQVLDLAETRAPVPRARTGRRPEPALAAARRAAAVADAVRIAAAAADVLGAAHSRRRCTATSSPRTSCCARTAACACSTSASPARCRPER